MGPTDSWGTHCLVGGPHRRLRLLGTRLLVMGTRRLLVMGTRLLVMGTRLLLVIGLRLFFRLLLPRRAHCLLLSTLDAHSLLSQPL
jgi:hypothetical protein